MLRGVMMRATHDTPWCRYFTGCSVQTDSWTNWVTDTTFVFLTWCLLDIIDLLTFIFPPLSCSVSSSSLTPYVHLRYLHDAILSLACLISSLHVLHPVLRHDLSRHDSNKLYKYGSQL
ncbi:hypothetical protein BJV78DRAFT_111941 [Lactifluus subvellereus]|nr:hypothetical protein BJV78DRAFT_111941 [Lactifluus subvellereus]